MDEKQSTNGRRTAPQPSGQRRRANHGSHPSRRQLSAVDAAFLYLERKELPLHIASVSIFDGPIPFDAFASNIRSKLRLVPRYRQIVVTPPYNLGLPTWEDDPDFDIHRHIFRETLEPPGGDEELEALAGRIFSRRMDRSKPLWDVYVVDGLKGGRGAIIWRLHHALADGISGTHLLEVMLDPTPEASLRVRSSRLPPPRPPTPPRSVSDEISNTVHGALGGLLALERGLLGFAQALASEQVQTALKGLFGLLPELAASVERLPFNKPCSGDRKFCWAELNFADVSAVREKVGGTVNDVVLTVLTRALARYVKLHGETVHSRFVRVVCPVSLRHGQQNGDLGNLISFMPVALPMDIRSPVQMLRAVSKRTETMKRAGAAHLVALAAGCIAAAPPVVQQLFWWGLPQLILPVPLFNLICTDVPGPPVPLYAAGRRMIATYPQVPTGYDLGVNVAAQSYDGKLFFGLIADAHVAKDVKRLRDFLYVGFKELCVSAGVKPARAVAAVSDRRDRRSRPSPVGPGLAPAKADASVGPTTPDAVRRVEINPETVASAVCEEAQVAGEQAQVAPTAPVEAA